MSLIKNIPEYGFAEHKGYSTPEHQAALVDHGPCPEHRFSYVNVAAVAGRPIRSGTVGVAPGVIPDAQPGVASDGQDPWPPSMGENEFGMESGAR